GPRARLQLPGAGDGGADRHPLVRDRRPRGARVREGRAPRRALPRRGGGAHRRVLRGSEQGRDVPGVIGARRGPRRAPGAAARLLRENGVTGVPAPVATTGQEPVVNRQAIALFIILLLALILAPVWWLGSGYQLDVARRALYAACLTGIWSLLAGVAG